MKFMKSFIKNTQILIVLFIFLPSVMNAEIINIGKIVKKRGYVSKTNINCDTDNCSRSDTFIYPGDRIVTGFESEAYILLNDGTALEVLEKSDIIIFSVVDKKNKVLTNIFSDYGKFKIIQHNDFMETSLVFKTRTAIIKSVCSTFQIITVETETGIFVYKSEAGFASVDPSITEAYIIKNGFESFLKKNTVPLFPREVPVSLRSSWLKRRFLNENNDRIIIYDNKKGPADWPFIEKK